MHQGLVSKPENINWAVHGFYEYLLVIHPSQAICERIIEEQQQFFLEYGVKRVTQVMPYIMVANFLAREAMEDTLLRWLQRICNRQQGFEIMLNNYSGIPPYSIYIRVQDPQPFQQIAQQLKPVNDYICASGCPPVKAMGRPRINIAARLSEQVYMKAMPEYSAKTFNEKFMAQELLLLKRAHPFDACKKVNVFRFLPAQSNVFSEVA